MGCTFANPNFPGGGGETHHLDFHAAASQGFCCQHGAAGSRDAKAASKGGGILSHRDTGRARGVPGYAVRVGESG